MSLNKRKWSCKTRSATPKATDKITIKDLAWAAGFLEGEGSFIRAKSCRSGCEMVSAPQKDPECLLKLQKFFGGTISSFQTIHPIKHTKMDYKVSRWQVYGARARGIMMTLFYWMSISRKQQIKLALIGE